VRGSLFGRRVTLEALTTFHSDAWTQTRSAPRRPFLLSIDARYLLLREASGRTLGRFAGDLATSKTTYDRCMMFSRLLLIAGLIGVWSCSDDDKPGTNTGGGGSGSAGFAGRSSAGASGSADAGQAGSRTAGHGGSSLGGAMIGGAGEAASGSGNLGGERGGNHAGASGAGFGGADAGGSAAGAGGASSDENPYRDCANEDSCPMAGSMCHADYGCEPPCPTGTVSCPAPVGGGTATPYCQQKLCRLDCGFGKTCPTGLTCDTPTGFCTPNGQ
jgi:hypothetical protein